MAHYTRESVLEFAAALIRLEQRLIAREKKWENGLLGRFFGALHLKKTTLKLRGLLQIMSFFAWRLRWGRMLKGWGPVKLFHAAMLPLEVLFGRKPLEVIERHTHVQNSLQVIILPLEDNYVIETDRLQRCPTLHAYFDPETEEAKYIPVCAWRLHNQKILQGIVKHYSDAKMADCD